MKYTELFGGLDKGTELLLVPGNIEKERWTPNEGWQSLSAGPGGELLFDCIFTFGDGITPVTDERALNAKLPKKALGELRGKAIYILFPCSPKWKKTALLYEKRLLKATDAVITLSLDKEQHQFEDCQDANPAYINEFTDSINANPVLQSANITTFDVLQDMKEHTERRLSEKDDNYIDLWNGEAEGEKETTGRERKDDRPLLNTESLMLELCEFEIAARTNLISRKTEIKPAKTSYAYQTYGGRELDRRTATNFMYDRIRSKYAMTRRDIEECFLDILQRQRYNPLIDLLESPETTWDGKDRIQELFEILRIEADELAKALLRKWLYQAMVLIRNTETQTPESAEGVLILVSDRQGIGKTLFAQMLGFDTDKGRQYFRPEFFKQSEKLDPSDKDSVSKATACFITELGEIDSTFRKSDSAELKEFITRPQDTYRPPYGAEAINFNRITSFIGSCNDLRCLQNDGENRRYWTIPLDGQKLDIKRMTEEFDALQLWKQVYSFVVQNTKPGRSAKSLYALTQKEQAALAERNGNYTQPLRGEEEVNDILTAAQDKGQKFTRATVTEFLAAHRETLGRYSAADIGKVFRKLGVEQSKSRKDGRHYLLPMPQPDEAWTTGTGYQDEQESRWAEATKAAQNI